jgi:toxin FitB
VADLLVDTDVFVEHLRGAHELRRGDDSLSYSVITRAELFAGRATDENRVELLLAPFREHSVDREIAEAAGRLRRDSDLLLPDALIAATALGHGLALVTRNRPRFTAVNGLDVRDPRAR